MSDPVLHADAFEALYDALLTRLDHSDTLYYGQLNACTTINLAIAAGFGALITSTHMSDIDALLVMCCGVAGLSITQTFNYYMRNEKQYQHGLHSFYNSLPESRREAWPPPYQEFKTIEARMVPDGWSRIPFLFFCFWIIVTLAGVLIIVIRFLR